MSQRPKTIGGLLTALAIDIIEAVKGQDVPLDTKLDAFKHLTNFYVGSTRVASKVPEDDKGDSIAGFRERIEAAQAKGYKKDTWKERQLEQGNGTE